MALSPAAPLLCRRELVAHRADSVSLVTPADARPTGVTEPDGMVLEVCHGIRRFD